MSRSRKRLLMQVADDDDGPLVASFPGGLPSASSSKFMWKRKDGKHCLIGKDSSCHYYGELPPQTASSKLLIALYDKDTHTVTLHSTQGPIYSMQQTATGYKLSNRTDDDKIDTTASSNLFDDFGSARKRRAIRSQRASRIHEDQVLGKSGALTKLVVDQNAALSESNRKAIQDVRESLQENAAAATTTTSAAAAQATDEWRTNFLPHHANPQADQPSQVYRPDRMAGSECWSMATRVVDACFRTGDPVKALTETKRKATAALKLPSVLGLIQRIPEAKKVYFQALWLLGQWADIYVNNHKKRFCRASTQNAASMSFWHNFGTSVMSPKANQGPSFCMSKANQDRCKLHLMLLFLWIDKCSTKGMAEFISDLQWSWPQASQLLRLAGCKVTKTLVSLTTPVVFPSGVRKGRK